MMDGTSLVDAVDGVLDTYKDLGRNLRGEPGIDLYMDTRRDLNRALRRESSTHDVLEKWTRKHRHAVVTVLEALERANPADERLGPLRGLDAALTNTLLRLAATNISRSAAPTLARPSLRPANFGPSTSQTPPGRHPQPAAGQSHDPSAAVPGSSRQPQWPSLTESSRQAPVPAAYPSAPGAPQPPSHIVPQQDVGRMPTAPSTSPPDRSRSSTTRRRASPTGG
jgi:hypothetical protein